MTRFLTAAVLAVAVHLVLAAGWLALLSSSDEECPTPPELDLSRVELSLSEKPVENLPPVAEPLPASSAVAAPVPETPAPEPLPPPTVLTVPPEMETVEWPDPQETTTDWRQDEPPPPEPPPPEPPTDEPPADAPSEPASGPSEPVADEDVPRSEPCERKPPQPAPDQPLVETTARLTKGFDLKRIYPAEARRKGQAGEVQLEFRVTASGTVAEVAIVTSSGYPLLDEAALKAARKAKFEPARRGDERVASVVRLKLVFRLTDR